MKLTFASESLEAAARMLALMDAGEAYRYSDIGLTAGQLETLIRNGFISKLRQPGERASRYRLTDVGAAAAAQLRRIIF